MNTTSIDRRRRPHRWPEHHAQILVQRIDRLQRKSRQQASPTITHARQILFDPQARTSTRERLLIALIDHPDVDAAADLLSTRRLPSDNPRLRFVLSIARRRQRRRRPVSHLRAA